MISAKDHTAMKDYSVYPSLVFEKQISKSGADDGFKLTELHTLGQGCLT